MTEIKLGIYRHYKGPLYQVLGIAHDANADTLGVLTPHVNITTGYVSPSAHEPFGKRTVVVYMPLQLDGAHLGPRMAVRTLEDFTAQIHPDGSTCSHRFHCGFPYRPRFAYLGQELTAEMIDSE